MKKNILILGWACLLACLSAGAQFRTNYQLKGYGERNVFRYFDSVARNTNCENLTGFSKAYAFLLVTHIDEAGHISPIASIPFDSTETIPGSVYDYAIRIIQTTDGRWVRTPGFEENPNGQLLFSIVVASKKEAIEERLKDVKAMYAFGLGLNVSTALKPYVKRTTSINQLLFVY